ncbi:MAG: hypothetical protein ACR2FP_07730 [Nocardioidaceae bacterium]
MARDAFEPGPNGDYPAFPRDSLGRPSWSDSADTDGVAVDTEAPMPRGIRYQRNQYGQRVAFDVTPRGPGGVAIDPPTIPPGG